MAKKDTIHPWQQIEEQAFHAFREWPLWLVLRERELAQRTAETQPDAPPAAKADTASQQPAGN
ncbi:MAG: hypothetical protein K8L97_17595 [Anaerolineae bacterium]|nr:hypothetical protein [Anaerolineae bacterium]